jgi:2-methylcitrate dehydratase PrpD
MGSVTRQLADFVADASFDALPREVAEYAKLVLLDGVICGLAAGGFQRTAMMNAVVAALGGPEEATVFGASRRAPALHAAMANTEAMNLLDADDTFFNSSHFAAFSTAAGLAEAQRLHRSGRELICALAVGFDISARLNLAQLVMEEKDGAFRWSPVQGMGFAAFGAGSSAAVLAHLSRDQVQNVFGLVSWMAPTPAAARMGSRTTFDSMKYANYAGPAHAGVLATRLAEQGYTGDQACLDTDPGFLEAQGGLRSDRSLLVEELGRKWWILETAIKYYPSCRYTHGPIDLLLRLMREHGIAAGEIEEIEVRLNPMAHAMPFFRDPPRRIEPGHRAPLDGAFNIAYVLALAALGRRPGPLWYARETLTDPEVWQLAARVRTAVNPDAAQEAARAFCETRIRRFRETRSAMTLRAGGRSWDAASKHCDGDPWTPETRPTWERLRRKFHDFCGDLLPEHAIDGIANRFAELEAVEDVAVGLPLGA